MTPRAGDILLSKGDLAHAKGIAMTTGGSYSHATLWSGDRVIEATLPRVQEVALEDFEGHVDYIDAFRHRRLGDRGAAVVAHARDLVTRPYSRIDLLLTSAISVLSAWPKAPWPRYNALYQAGRARTLLDRISQLYLHGKGDALTCVELVVRAHTTVGLPIHVRIDPKGEVDWSLVWTSLKSLYALDGTARRRDHEGVAGPGKLHGELAAWESLDAELQWAQQCQRSLSAGYELGVAKIAALDLTVGEDWPAAFVTPQQLEDSPSLERQGRVYDRRASEAT